MSRIDEIKERHTKVQGIPWKMSEYSNDYYTSGYNVKDSSGRMIAQMIEEEEDVKFISSAPTDVRYLMDKLERVGSRLKEITEFKILSSNEEVVDEYYNLRDKLIEIMVDIKEEGK
jgi:uncharacterized membrane protein